MRILNLYKMTKKYEPLNLAVRIIPKLTEQFVPIFHISGLSSLREHTLNMEQWRVWAP